MVIWLKDIEGSWHRINCADFEYYKNVYVFLDENKMKIAQFYEPNIIGFRIKRKKGDNGNQQRKTV